jgi:tetratricopeptide (TPR) repeat protein
MSLAHWKLGNEKELPEPERARHKAEARRWYDQAVKQMINSWGPGGNSVVQASRAFRAEAAELLGVNQAIKSLEMLVAAQPNAWEPRVNLAEAYAKEGMWEKAAAEHTKATEVKPDRWEPWSRRASFHFNRKQWDRAIADFSRAIELAPQVHTNWWHRGHAYLQLAQWDKAAAEFGTIVDRWPDGVDGWYLRAVAFAQLKQPDKAIANLRKAIAKGFNNVEQLKNDPRFAPLRNREDFGKLVEELERKGKSQRKQNGREKKKD